MGIADWAEVLFTGGLWGGEGEWVGTLPVPTPLCTNALKWPEPVWSSPTHQGGRCCLGRRSSQVCQHLLHLGQLLSTDIICIWVSGRWGQSLVGLELSASRILPGREFAILEDPELRKS